MASAPLSVARKFRRLSLALLLTAAVLVPVALFAPVSTKGDVEEGAVERPLGALGEPRNVEPLLRKLAGRRLIRPAQVQAAVRDGGAAATLLKRLALRGVVEREGDYVAYVEVEKEGTKVLRKNDSILGFQVEEVAPGKVILSLEGVLVELSH